MFAAAEKVRGHQFFNIIRLYRSVGDTLAVHDHLNQRLEPARTPGTVPYQLDVFKRRNFFSDLIGAQRNGSRLPWHVDSDFAGHRAAPESLSKSSSFSLLTRPCTLSSISTAGEHAQLPRQ